MDRIFELEFWMKWFIVALYVGLTLTCFSGAFDRTQDISQVGRFILGICGIVCGAIATFFYRVEL